MNGLKIPEGSLIGTNLHSNVHQSFFLMLVDQVNTLKRLLCCGLTGLRVNVSDVSEDEKIKTNKKLTADPESSVTKWVKIRFVTTGQIFIIMHHRLFIEAVSFGVTQLSMYEFFCAFIFR